jgi:hypothetical protein
VLWLRPIATAIVRKPSPRARPREISSRSSLDKQRAVRCRATGLIPPVDAT